MEITWIPISWDMFNPLGLHFIRQRGKSKRPVYMASSFIGLDTETSKIVEEDTAWLYQWCFSYPKGNGERWLVYGRRPSELAEALVKVVSKNKLHMVAGRTIPVYIHNLSYDYTYIKDYIKLYFKQSFSADLVEEQSKLLAIAPHKILSWEICGLVFKCSFRLTGKSLDQWSKELGTHERKLVGAIDYEEIRYQDSKLNRMDWRYMFGDVKTLDESIILQLKKWKDTLKTIPLTVTGYVRRETRREYKKDPKNREQFKKKALNLHVYRLLRKEFAGGLTHGNRYYANKTLRAGKTQYKTLENIWKIIEDFGHGDFISHYPTQELTKGMPVSPFRLYHEHSFRGSIMSLQDLQKLAEKYCILATITISRLEIRKGVTLPYAQASKFRAGRIDSLEMIEDNGRVLKMLNGHTKIVVNEHDLKWLMKQYTFDYLVDEVYIAERGPCPDFLQNTIRKFMKDKSKYKKEEKHLLKDGFSEIDPVVIAKHLDLMISKGLLNGIYGMMATDPIRESWLESDTGLWSREPMTEEEYEKKLQEFFDNENNFANYELGCWTTSAARDQLMDFVECVGYDHFVYADTDSIFYISDDETRAKLKAKNEELMKLNEANHYYIELDGKKEYVNQFEDEGEDIRSFRFLHAKCYAYEAMEEVTVKDKKTKEEKKVNKLQLHTTIAGVKQIGRNGNNRVKELGSIDNLEGDKKFYDCGGTSCTYITGLPDIVDINGHVTETASAAIIKNVDKTLTAEINLGCDMIRFMKEDIND